MTIAAWSLWIPEPWYRQILQTSTPGHGRHAYFIGRQVHHLWLVEEVIWRSAGKVPTAGKWPRSSSVIGCWWAGPERCRKEREPAWIYTYFGAAAELKAEWWGPLPHRTDEGDWHLAPGVRPLTITCFREWGE